MSFPVLTPTPDTTMYRAGKTLSDANYEWLEDLDYRDDLMLPIKGVPHDY